MNLRTTRWSTLALACRRNNTSRLLSIDTNLIMGNLGQFSPEARDDQSDFLESLANCRVEAIGDDIDVIRLNKLGVPWECFGPQKLFVRQFYADLLSEIRRRHSSVLIGNPGIAKSFFQYYYLARILNPSMFGPFLLTATAPPPRRR